MKNSLKTPDKRKTKTLVSPSEKNPQHNKGLSLANEQLPYDYSETNLRIILKNTDIKSVETFASLELRGEVFTSSNFVVSVVDETDTDARGATTCRWLTKVPSQHKIYKKEGFFLNMCFTEKLSEDFTQKFRNFSSLQRKKTQRNIVVQIQLLCSLGWS